MEPMSSETLSSLLHVGDHQVACLHQVADPRYPQEVAVADEEGEEGKQQAASEKHLII